MKTRTLAGTVVAGALLGLSIGTAASADATLAPSATLAPTATATATATASASTATLAPARNCEAYNYYGTSESLCAAFPNNTDVDCPQVKYRVTLVKKVDPWDLSHGGDAKVGCESYPIKGSTSTPTRTATATPTRTATATASPSRSTVAPVPTRAELPKTGSGVAKMGLVLGAVLVFVGTAATVMARRRRTKFEA